MSNDIKNDIKIETPIPETEVADKTAWLAAETAPEPGENAGARESPNIALVKQVLEAALLTSKEALAMDALMRLFEPPVPGDTLRALLDDLKSDWSTRGVSLVLVATGYRFQANTEMQSYIDRLEPERAPRYSRATMETLAIIAYRQPTTRGEIEAIRGVAVSSHVIKALEDREWIEVIGHKESPGRPALYATTQKFLNDLSLRSLSELPALADLDEHPALELPDVPLEPPFPQQGRLDTLTGDGQTIIEMPAETSAQSPVERNDGHHGNVPPTLH